MFEMKLDIDLLLPLGFIKWTFSFTVIEAPSWWLNFRSPFLFFAVALKDQPPNGVTQQDGGFKAAAAADGQIPEGELLLQVSDPKKKTV